MRALLRHIHSDLVILDLSPEKRDDGYQLLMRLWNDAETAQIPAIIITGEPGLPPVRAGMLHTRGGEARRPRGATGRDQDRL